MMIVPAEWAQITGHSPAVAYAMLLRMARRKEAVMHPARGWREKWQRRVCTRFELKGPAGHRHRGTHTMSTIERVAKAMRQKYAEMTGEVGLVDFEVSRARDEWLACARTALEELRAPSDFMADQAAENYVGITQETAVAWAKDDKWAAHRADLIESYQNFIDAALEEGRTHA